MRRRTGTCIAHDDNGRYYTIHIYTVFAPAADPDTPDVVMKGQQELQTSNGTPIRRIEKGVYEVVVAGVTITMRSDSEDAP
jgi:hypothetical protein